MPACTTPLRSLLALGVLLLAGCESPAPRNTAAIDAPAPADTLRVSQGPVRTGAFVLVDDDFAPLRGRRVGLVVNHTALVDTTHVVDLFHASPHVELGALFGPEHGLRGTADAGEEVSDGRDSRTGVPIYSLYGETRKPTPAMLENIDVLVFDIQDIGARFYTYISTMGLAMQAAAEAGIPFVVLDRPNPIGGTLVSGFVREPAYESFVGQYPIPVAHGLTVGELAQMIRGEGYLDGLETLELTVIPMEGWERTMLWPETGLPWVPPSPNIPDFETALVYPGACFFEGTRASEGRGTGEPFKLLGAPWADSRALADTLNARGLPGVRFEAATFTPRPMPGMSSNPKLAGEALQGIHYVVTDAAAFRPVDTGIHALHAFYHQAPPTARRTFFNRDWLAKLAGTDRLYELLTAGASPETIVAAWQEDVETFRERREPYLIY